MKSQKTNYFKANGQTKVYLDIISFIHGIRTQELKTSETDFLIYK